MTKRIPEPNAGPDGKITSQERTAIGRFFARNAANPAPRLKVTKGKYTEIAPQHRDAVVGQMLLMDALGTSDVDFYDGLIKQLASFDSPEEQTYEQRLNFMLSVVKGIQPRDQLEAMLAAQMATVHMLSMALAQRLAQSRTCSSRTAPNARSTSSPGHSQPRWRRSSATEAVASRRQAPRMGRSKAAKRR